MALFRLQPVGDMAANKHGNKVTCQSVTFARNQNPSELCTSASKVGKTGGPEDCCGWWVSAQQSQDQLLGSTRWGKTLKSN